MSVRAAKTVVGAMLAVAVLLPVSDAFAWCEAVARCTRTGAVGTGSASTAAAAKSQAIEGCIARGGIPECCRVIQANCDSGSGNNSGGNNNYGGGNNNYGGDGNYGNGGGNYGGGGNSNGYGGGGNYGGGSYDNRNRIK